jgi:hypothetical protein
MASRQLAVLELGGAERDELKSLAAPRNTAQALALRARIVLAWKAATIAVAMIGQTPGSLVSLRQSSFPAEGNHPRIELLDPTVEVQQRASSDMSASATAPRAWAVNHRHGPCGSTIP